MSARIDRKVRSTGGGGPIDPSTIDVELLDQVGTLDNNTMVGTDATGVLGSIPGFYLDTTYGGMNITKQIDLNNAGSATLHNFNLLLSALQNSPNDRAVMHNLWADIDPDLTGFGIGTNGNALTLHNMYIRHIGESNTGSLGFTQTATDIGNGTDAITVEGIFGFLNFTTVNANVTIDGAMQGFIYQPSVNASATMGSNGYVNAFGDFANMAIGVNSYASFSASPTVSSVNNNNGIIGFNVNPNITTFTGNASYTGLNLVGTLGTFGTGGYQGLYINPTVTSAAYANGIFVDVSNITVSGTKYAIQTVGDVNIGGSLTFSGALSIGALNAYYAVNPVNGGGNPLTIHGLVSAMNTVASTTVANADAIGVNTAMLVTLAANSVSTSGPLELGFTALALPCVVETHTGSTLDFMSGTTAAINLAGTSTGGTISNLRVSRSVVIPNGITTVTNSYGYYYDEPFGGVATNAWGFYTSAAVDNFLKQSLKIGGTVGTTDRVTNSSVGLELEATDRAVLLSRMNSTAEGALTALDGMLIYNTTTAKFRGRAGGAWVDLH